MDAFRPCDSRVVTVLQMRKLSHKVVPEHAQGLTASNFESGFQPRAWHIVNPQYVFAVIVK